MKRFKQHIVLVHGSCHGAWCWYKVATLLEAAGFRVTAPDLAASGIDGRRLSEVATLAAYSQPLLDVVASLPDREKAVLVGHSFGGLSVALAADRYPEKVAAVVFVAAFMPDCTSRPSYVLEKCKYSWSRLSPTNGHRSENDIPNKEDFPLSDKILPSECPNPNAEYLCKSCGSQGTHFL